MRFKLINDIPDSIDKIVSTYFSVVTSEEFKYRRKIYTPKPYIISTNVFYQYTCPGNCGGCCLRFSLDYIPQEINQIPDWASLRFVKLTHKKSRNYIVYSDLQPDNKTYHCKYLNFDNGLCNTYEMRPFSCDFELIRFMHFKDPNVPNRITTKVFGRGWQYKRVDGKQGALCVVTPVITDENIKEVKRKFLRLRNWCEFFELKHSVDKILKWINDYEFGLTKQKILINP